MRRDNSKEMTSAELLYREPAFRYTPFFDHPEITGIVQGLTAVAIGFCVDFLLGLLVFAMWTLFMLSILMWRTAAINRVFKKGIRK